MKLDGNLILFDDTNRNNLLPLAFTRPIAELRIGITTIKQKWEFLTDSKCSYLVPEYLAKKFPVKLTGQNIFINASLIPDSDLIREITLLKSGEALKGKDILLAYVASEPIDSELANLPFGMRIKLYPYDFISIRNLWDIFLLNEKVLRDDYFILTKGRKSLPLSDSNQLIGRGNVFIEEGAIAECAVINTNSGPVYIGKDAEIMEGSLIRGPFAICEHSVLKMGAKVYGATTIGPYSKVGGEINNSVITGYSNKAHDGFLGNSVLGEWCNLGANCNNSNLKNNYAEVKLWNYNSNKFNKTGLLFCGLFMGDHSKSGISSMFNTGTVVGVSANIFGTGFPRNFIPSFSWGGNAGFTVYQKSKAYEAARIAMQRRKVPFTEEDIKILDSVFDLTEQYRKFL